MNWEAVAALVALAVAVATAAYTFGVLSTKVTDLKEEVKRARDRLDHYIDSQKHPHPHE